MENGEWGMGNGEWEEEGRSKCRSKRGREKRADT